MVSPAVIVEGWEVGMFLPGSSSPLTFLLEHSQWKKSQLKARLNLVPCRHAHTHDSCYLGVRLNIEVGGFSAVRALASCWNTQLTYTPTQTSFCCMKKPLCMHQPNDTKRYDYHLVNASFPLAFSYISINSHWHWVCSLVHILWHM